MATVAVSRPDLFPEGTLVRAYLEAAFHGQEGPPQGPEVTSATVTGGVALLTGLVAGTQYVAYAVVNAEQRVLMVAPAGTTGIPSGVFVSAEDFGAVGSGDETSQIEDAISSLPAWGGTLLLKAMYTVSRTIVQKSNVTIRGEGLGTGLRLGNNANCTLLESQSYATLKGGCKLSTKASQESPAGLRLFDLTLDGNKANNTSGSGVLWYASNVGIFNVVVKNCKQIGVKTEWSGASGPLAGTDSMESCVSFLKVHDNGEYGLVHAGAHDGIVENTFAWNNNKAGIWVPEQNSSGTYWKNSHSYSDPASNEGGKSQEYGWLIEHGITCEGCTSEGSTKAQVVLAEGTKWIGGRVFSTSGGKGTCFQWGFTAAEHNTATGVNTILPAFNCQLLDVEVTVPAGGAAAFTFVTGAGSTGSRVRARVVQKEGAVIAGTPSTDFDWIGTYYAESSEGAPMRVTYSAIAPVKPGHSNPNVGDMHFRSGAAGNAKERQYICTTGGASPVWESMF